MKDLRIFKNREKEDLIYVDSNPMSHIYQFENAIPIVPFDGNRKDKQLLKLYLYLKRAINSKDFNQFNDDYFKTSIFLKTIHEMKSVTNQKINVKHAMNHCLAQMFGPSIVK